MQKVLTTNEIGSKLKFEPYGTTERMFKNRLMHSYTLRVPIIKLYIGAG